MPAGIYPFDPEMPHEQRAQRQIKLLKAGVLGPPNGPAKSSKEIQEIYFDVIARSARTDAVEDPFTVQWKFSDAEPWHVVVDNGSSRAERGIAEGADVTLMTTWPQWIEISMRGENPLRAIMRRRLRPRGSLRELRRLTQIWEPRQVTGDTAPA
jgi:hypothetical protein